MPLDVTKPVQTSGGRKARIVCTDRRMRSGMPVMALITDDEGDELICVYALDGKRNLFASEDLINVPEQRRIWINYYRGDVAVTVHSSRREADTYAYDWNQKKSRFACVESVATENQGI